MPQSVKAIRIHEQGAPSVMKLENVEAEALKPGQVRVRHEAIGVNFIDTYHRSGLYKIALPSGIGMEAAGVVENIGEGVTGFKPGDRVGYCSGPIGAYAEAHTVSAAQLMKLPDGVSAEDAAALMLKGLTVQYLFRSTYRLKGGETILFHAAAGGVGLIACQWAKHLGVTMIGTVGSDDKAGLALSNGCTHVINYHKEDVVARVKEITGGKGVPVVYDGVGKDTFTMSLDCLSPRGLLASFGNSSGSVTGVDLGILAAKGSLYVTRPTLFHYISTRDELDAASAELFDLVARGIVKAGISQRFALADAVKAHEALASRNTVGATVLIP
ncbi:MAG: quinone oxidoreductase [Parvibaculaceae bacterium]|nr:quinone oxidoreductase [Parvibaculaceae bacterium]